MTAGPDRFAGRRARAFLALAGSDAAALLVSDPANLRWLTGFTGSNGALLLAAETAVLVTDDRYRIQSARECPGLDTEFIRAAVVGAGSLAAAGRVGPLDSLAIEAGHITLTIRDALGKAAPDVTLVPTSGLVEALRVVKDDDEIATIRRACRISVEALEALLPDIRVGLTERHVARRLEALMAERGSDGPSFETIVAAGENAAVPHHRPTERPLSRGDLLKIDFGALLDGYHADCTRTVVLGPPADWQREIHALVAEAQAAGRAATVAGTALSEMDAAARRVIADAGHAEHYGHGLGHGVGLAIHEAPMVNGAATGILAAGTAVTVEPGVYLPGRGGVRIEDTLVARVGPPENLTETTRELLVVG